MKTTVNNLEDLWDQTEEYSKTTYELTKLKALEAGALITVKLIAKIGVILSASIFILIINIGIAFFLGDLIGEIYYGFFIVAGFYLLATLILHQYLYKWINKIVCDIIIKQALQ